MCCLFINKIESMRHQQLLCIEEIYIEDCFFSIVCHAEYTLGLSHTIRNNLVHKNKHDLKIHVVFDEYS